MIELILRNTRKFYELIELMQSLMNSNFVA
jgi:hypothetical protein